jgi:hypothetical protein
MAGMMVRTRKAPLAPNSLRSCKTQVQMKIDEGYTRDMIKGGAGLTLPLPCPLCEPL